MAIFLIRCMHAALTKWEGAAERRMRILRQDIELTLCCPLGCFVTFINNLQIMSSWLLSVCAIHILLNEINQNKKLIYVYGRALILTWLYYMPRAVKRFVICTIDTLYKGMYTISTSTFSLHVIFYVIMDWITEDL